MTQHSLFTVGEIEPSAILPEDSPAIKQTICVQALAAHCLSLTDRIIEDDCRKKLQLMQTSPEGTCPLTDLLILCDYLKLDNELVVKMTFEIPASKIRTRVLSLLETPSTNGFSS